MFAAYLGNLGGKEQEMPTIQWSNKSQTEVDRIYS